MVQEIHIGGMQIDAWIAKNRPHLDAQEVSEAIIFGTINGGMSIIKNKGGTAVYGPTYELARLALLPALHPHVEEPGVQERLRQAPLVVSIYDGKAGTFIGRCVGTNSQGGCMLLEQPQMTAVQSEWEAEAIKRIGNLYQQGKIMLQSMEKQNLGDVGLTSQKQPHTH